MCSFHPDRILCDKIPPVTCNMADFSVRLRVKTQRSQLPGEKGIESEFPVYSRAFRLPGPWPLTTLCRIFLRCFTRYSLIGVLYLVPWYVGLGGPGMFECCLASSCTVCKRGKSSPPKSWTLKKKIRWETSQEEMMGKIPRCCGCFFLSVLFTVNPGINY